MTDPERTRTGRPLVWWHEVLIAAVFYAVYSAIRNTFGAGPESRAIAFEHARSIIDLQDAFGLWFEPDLQAWYLDLPHRGLIRWWNIFYGTAHFVVTIGVLVFAYKRRHRYRFLRTVLATTTLLALIGYASYTLMPPRLLDANGEYGACAGQEQGCHGYEVVDTIDRWGGLWKFDSGAMSSVSNQYAAMPSMHFGWSTWCAIAAVLVIGRGWRRWLWFLYPAATLFCIVVTGNHYWLDALFGVVALGIGWLAAKVLEQREQRRTGGAPRTGPRDGYEAGEDHEPAGRAVGRSVDRSPAALPTVAPSG